MYVLCVNNLFFQYSFAKLIKICFISHINVFFYVFVFRFIVCIIDVYHKKMFNNIKNGVKIVLLIRKTVYLQ